MRTSLRLAPEPRSVRQARQHVRHTLEEAGREDRVDDAALAVSELVSNVVLHACTDCELSVSVTGHSVRVDVRDFSTKLPVERHFGSDATTGRGLAIVAGLSTEFGIDPLGHDGKIVWFVLDGAAGDATADE